MECPEVLPEEPKVKPHLTFYWDAFWELGADRHTGFSLGRIPFLAIDRFAGRYGIVELDEFDRFKSLIRGLDAAFRTFEAKKAERAQNNGRGLIDISDWQAVKARFDLLKAERQPDADNRDDPQTDH